MAGIFCGGMHVLLSTPLISTIRYTMLSQKTHLRCKTGISILLRAAIIRHQHAVVEKRNFITFSRHLGQ